MTIRKFEPKKVPRFEQVLDALLALSCDRLARVDYAADRVYVFTAFGTGEFSRSDWDLYGGPRPSVEKEGPDVA